MKRQMKQVALVFDCQETLSQAQARLRWLKVLVESFQPFDRVFMRVQGFYFANKEW